MDGCGAGPGEEVEEQGLRDWGLRDWGLRDQGQSPDSLPCLFRGYVGDGEIDVAEEDFEAALFFFFVGFLVGP